MHLEVLLEEPSAEAALDNLLPALLPEGTTWRFHVFSGKADLLRHLASRLKGYATWLPDDWRILVLVDRDGTDCQRLLERLEQSAAAAGLATKVSNRGGRFTVLNRLAIEELEAWFFGDVEALSQAYPGVSPHLAHRRGLRSPDQIAGGTWEALQRELKRAGHYRNTGLPKIEVATNVSRHMVPARNTSRSFKGLVLGLRALMA